MKNILNYLIENNQTITFAESMTGGLLSYELVKHPGASKVYKEGYILYSDEAKVKVLGMNQEDIDKYGVVSHEVASQMATQLHKLTQADFSVAITGYASGKAENKAFIGIIHNNLLYVDDIVFFEDNRREKNIRMTIRKVIKMLHEIIKK